MDLIVNPEVKQTFIKRSAILRELRSYLDGKGFLEVETPILTPFEIGASARPFLTHHNTLDMDMVLRIETELYLKRLMVGGMDRVYEVGRIFRNEGMDPKHNPEFTTIELYQAYTDYHGMMDLVEEMMKTVAQKVCGTLQIPYQGQADRPVPLGADDHDGGGEEVFRRGLRHGRLRRGGRGPGQGAQGGAARDAHQGRDPGRVL